MSRLEDLRDRLVALGEDLDDVAMDRLRDAVDRGEDAVPASEKKLAQARRAIEKAAQLVGAIADDEAG